MGERAFAAKFWNVRFIILFLAPVVVVAGAAVRGLLVVPPWLLAAEAMSRKTIS